MTVNLSIFTWQLLRAVLRSGPAYPTGRELRLVPTAKTRDGTFLTRLVEAGLLRVIKSNPDPFLATYTLTELGEHAAEFGEYEYRIPLMDGKKPSLDGKKPTRRAKAAVRR